MATSRADRRSHPGVRAAATVGGVGAAALGVAIAVSPTVRAGLQQVGRLVRPLPAPGPANAPDLPAGRIVPVPGRGEMFVRDTGGPAGRPTVLLLHGWGATADVNFFSVYAPLARSCRVLALDHRGHGRGPRSPEPFTLEACADDAAALLDALEVGPAVVVGYSMGGPIALLLANRHPAHVAGLVLVATALEWRQDRRDRALWRGLPLVEAGLRLRAGEGLVQRLLHEAIDKEPSLDPYRSWFEGEMRRGNVRDFVEAGRALSRFDARPYVAAVEAPAAVVVTTGDRLVPPRKQRALGEALHAPVFEIDADHDAPMANGAQFAHQIAAAVDHTATQAGLLAPRPRPPKRRRQVR
jgi:pimeloyl-ACP methyl ester carboxylesterase